MLDTKANNNILLKVNKNENDTNKMCEDYN